jgi:hypothetical protein
VVEQVPAPPESAESSGIAAISRVSEAKEEKRSTMSKSENAGELNMVISGEMTLKLNYQYAGQTVSIRFVDESLRVELTDGTEFKIPVRAAKKAA